MTRRKTERGAPGRTHCGRWTSDVPEGIWATRLVCSRPAKHRGWHRSEWFDGERPRRTPPSL